MDLRCLAWLFPVTACFAIAQTPTTIDCSQNPTLCEIDVVGQTLTLGMPKARALELLSKTSYRLIEDHDWSAEHKAYSLWHLTIPEHQPFAGAVKGNVKFRDDKLVGALVLWSPDSEEQTDFAASLINLLERFSKEGSNSCTLSVTNTARPQQEDRDATFQCGMRSVRVEHARFQSSFQGQKVPDYAAIYEILGDY